jgi:hypothetical protein
MVVFERETSLLKKITSGSSKIRMKVSADNFSVQDTTLYISESVFIIKTRLSVY